MMRNEILRTLANPSKITDTELATLPERDREHQPRRVGKRPRPRRRHLRRAGAKPLLPQPLGAWKIKTEKIAPILSHEFILTAVGTFDPFSTNEGPQDAAEIRAGAVPRQAGSGA